MIVVEGIPSHIHPWRISDRVLANLIPNVNFVFIFIIEDGFDSSNIQDYFQFTIVEPPLILLATSPQSCARLCLLLQIYW